MTFGIVNNKPAESIIEKNEVADAYSEVILVPSYASLSPLRELTVKDIRQFDLEKRLMYLPLSPIFFVYYATVQGDILGILRITDYEVLFEPLNPGFKGLFSYAKGDLNDNCRASFVVNLKDLACKPLSIPCPSMDPEDEEEIGIVMQVQIFLRHTGNYYHMSKPNKEVIDRKNPVGTASFHLKTKIAALDGQPWSNDERKKQAELIVNCIHRKAFARADAHPVALEKNSSMTSVPFFDIDFSAVLNPEAHRSPTHSGPRVTLDQVNKNLDLFKDLFGLHTIKESIFELKNQSFVPLDCLFPSKTLQIGEKTSTRNLEMNQDEDDLLKKSTAIEDGRRRITSKIMHLPDELKMSCSKLLAGSEILTLGAAKMVPTIYEARKGNASRCDQRSPVEAALL